MSPGEWIIWIYFIGAFCTYIGTVVVNEDRFDNKEVEPVIVLMAVTVYWPVIFSALGLYWLSLHFGQFCRWFPAQLAKAWRWLRKQTWPY